MSAPVIPTPSQCSNTGGKRTATYTIWMGALRTQSYGVHHSVHAALQCAQKRYSRTALLPAHACTSIDLSKSPSFSASAFLQSIMPAPVLSRSCFTAAAEISARAQHTGTGAQRHHIIHFQRPPTQHDSPICPSTNSSPAESESTPHALPPLSTAQHQSSGYPNHCPTGLAAAN